MDSLKTVHRICSIQLIFIITFAAWGLVSCEDYAGGRFEGEFTGPLDLHWSSALRARGYLAKEFFIKSKDGYGLSIVRGQNPLFAGENSSGKLGHVPEPILFIHGSNTSPLSFLINSSGVEPKDFSRYHYGNKKTKVNNSEELYERVGRDPSAKSLPFLAMNFGHDIWLLSRRGFRGSEYKAGHLNRTIDEIIAAIPEPIFDDLLNERTIPFRSLAQNVAGLQIVEKIFDTISKLAGQSIKQGRFHKLLDRISVNRKAFAHTFDPDYWHFALDQQAEFDLPRALEFIKSKSSAKQAIVVGHSSGGAIPLMALSERPNYYNRAVSKWILWAPSVNLGSRQVKQLSVLKPILEPRYKGPLPPVFFVFAMKSILRKLCPAESPQIKACRALVDSIMGASDEHENRRHLSPIIFPEPAGNYELSQLVQNMGIRKTSKYNYDTIEENLAAYGQAKAPEYNFSRITHPRLSIYGSNSDSLVTDEDLIYTSNLFSVPPNLTIIDQPGVKLNHAGFLLHEFASELVIVPSMWDILK